MPRILLTSVLKPVTDPRLLARLGRSLAELPGAEIHIAAHRAADAPVERVDNECANIRLHPIFDFPRLSLARALAGLRLLRLLRKLQPDILVVGTAELLPAALWWRRRTGGLLVYDVRENYALNLRTQQVFPPLVARVLAWLVTQFEAAAAPQLVGVLLAERAYATELPWLIDCCRVEIIENKYQPAGPLPVRIPEPLPSFSVVRPLRLVVTGTLSELYGTFRAVALVRVLVLRRYIFDLLLVGFCPLFFHYDKLKSIQQKVSWLQIEGGNAPVPHSRLIQALREADFALLPYQSHPSLDTCIPSKLWECMAEQVPVVVPHTARWRTVVAQYGAGFALDFDAPDAAEQFLAGLASGPFYPAGAPPEAFWAPEGVRLRAFFVQLEPVGAHSTTA